MSKISVLLPIHNGEETLERSLDSIYMQSCQDFEVVAILNNCTDGSSKILENFDAKVVTCETPGIVPALNTGIFHCRGEFIARMDADDYWYPEKLQKQLDFFEKNPDIDILGTQIRQVNTQYQEIKDQISYPTENAVIKRTLLSGSNCIAHPSVMFRKSITEKAGLYDDSFPLAEDYYYWLRCLRWYKFANLEEILLDYTSNPNPNYDPNVPILACQLMVSLYQHIGLIRQ